MCKAKRLREITELKKEFPEDFLWGASVAPHQVEGSTHNQWSAWEHREAASSASSAEERLSHLPVWNEVKKQATNPLNYVSGAGVEHYKKYKLDFQLASSLSLNALRSGVEWSRINPKKDVFDPQAVAHYSKYFASMKQQGLEPVMTLFHWSLPEWFAEDGGFEKSANLTFWRDFIHTVVHNMDLSNIKCIITINEANTYSSLSYAAGEFPPGEKDFWKSYRVYRNLAKAHKIAYKIIKAKYPHIQVGVAHQCNDVGGSGFIGRFLARVQRWYWNWSWLSWARFHDFVGMNYYFSDHWHSTKPDLAAAPTGDMYPKNDLGWYMNPSGIEDVILEAHKRYKKPIIVTENGVADMHDAYREWWISETIQALHACVKKGVPVIGYMHWSLLDNFEWQYGWFPKFGLIAVDRKTMQRTVKKSAKLWGAWLKG